MSPASRPLNRMIRQVLYSLKRQYGGTVDIFRLIGSHTDPKTGETVSTKIGFRVDRAIVLPAKIARDVERSISAISANKAMVMGGFYDSGTRMFIIDRSDVPEWPLGKDDWLVYANRKYAIDSIQEFECDSAWVVIGKALLGETPEQLHTLYAEGILTVDSSSLADISQGGAPVSSSNKTDTRIKAEQSVLSVLACLRETLGTLEVEHEGMFQLECLRSIASSLTVAQTSDVVLVPSANMSAYTFNTTQRKIQVFSLVGTYRRDLTAYGAGGAKHLQCDSSAKTVYWLESTNGIYRKAISEGYEAPNSLLISPTTYPGLKALCVDPVGARLYFTRSATGPVFRIARANLDGSGVVEYSFAENVDVLSMAMANGALYGLTFDSSLARCRLVRFGSPDLSQYTVLKDSLPLYPAGLTADPAGGWLFYASTDGGTGKYLYRVSLTGTNQQTISSLGNVVDGIAFCANTNRLYWADGPSLYSSAASPSSSASVLHTGSDALSSVGIL